MNDIRAALKAEPLQLTEVPLGRELTKAERGKRAFRLNLSDSPIEDPLTGGVMDITQPFRVELFSGAKANQEDIDEVLALQDLSEKVVRTLWTARLISDAGSTATIEMEAENLIKASIPLKTLYRFSRELPA